MHATCEPYLFSLGKMVLFNDVSSEIVSSGLLNIVAKLKRTRSKIVRVFGFKTVKSAVQTW